MASQTHVLLPTRSVSADETQETGVFDAGAYRTLEVAVRVFTPQAVGAGGVKLKLETAFEDEEGAWAELEFTDSSTDVDLGSLGVEYKSVARFLRYVRWKTDAGGGSAVISVGVVAKGG
jgi:hypothetical protein